MKIAAVILARIASTRLERKVLLDLEGIPVLAHVLRRSWKFPGVTDAKNGRGVVLALPEGDKENELASLGEEYGAKVVRGDEENVLSRLLKAADEAEADVVYRVTADNPLVDPGVVAQTWRGFSSGSWDYAAMDDTPLGTTVEIVTVDALRRAEKIADAPRLREHPTLALYENSNRFKMLLIPSPEKWKHPEWRLTVDREADFRVVRTIIGALGPDADLNSIVPYLLEHPQVAAINSEVGQDGWQSLKERKDAIGHE